MQPYTPQDPDPLNTRPQARRRRSDRYAARPAGQDLSPGDGFRREDDPPRPPRVLPPDPDAQRERADGEDAPARRKRVQSDRKRPKRALSLPRVLTLTLLVFVFVLCGAYFGLNTLRIAELREQRAREAREYQAVVDRHQPKYTALIDTYSEKYGVNPAFVAAIIYRESHYDPRAESGAGARGLMQLMPDTGTWMAEKAGLDTYTVDSLWDPETNIWLGTRYLNYLSGLFDGDPILVACGYHAGANNVRSWIQKYSSDGVHLTLEEIPREDSQTYARRVMESYAIYLQHYYPEDPAAAYGARPHGDAGPV